VTDATTGPAERSTYRHGDLRRALLEAGIQLARAGGPDAVVLREATRRAGVVPNAAYRHFASRWELLQAVRSAALSALAVAMEAELAKLPHGNSPADFARASLRAIGTAYLRFAQEETGLFRTAFAIPDETRGAPVPAKAGNGGLNPLQLLGATLRHLDVRFSVTTNGTLLEADDIALLRNYPFAVTVSLDGTPDIQNRQRPRHGAGRESWRAAIDRIAPLLANPGKAKIAARATVTRHSLDIASALETLAALGFPEVGFAPLRVGPAGAGALRDEDWTDYLAAPIAASRAELGRLKQGFSIRLTNLAIALKQLHRGASSPYPCGAGGGYFSVSAAGRWYACHRAIGNPAYELGSNEGLDAAARRAFVTQHHVHAQMDCRSCWARYLCSGSCHQEASARSIASCDFIRG
jgi:radical SAM protein with 4Fe4S-binding SPASM domain